MEITNQSQVFNKQSLNFGRSEATYPVLYKKPKDEVDSVTISNASDLEVTEADFDEVDGFEVEDGDNTQVTTVEDDIEDVGYGEEVPAEDNEKDRNKKYVEMFNDGKKQCLDFADKAEKSGIVGGKIAGKMGKLLASAFELGACFFLSQQSLTIAVNGFKVSTAGRIAANIATQIKEPAIDFVKNIAKNPKVIKYVGPENIKTIAKTVKGANPISAGVNALAGLTTVGAALNMATANSKKQEQEKEQ